MLWVNEISVVSLVTGVLVGGLTFFVLALIWTKRKKAKEDDQTRVLRSLIRGDTSEKLRLRPLGSVGIALEELAERLAARREKASERKARLAVILDAMVEAVVVTDSQGSITLTNTAMDRLVGARVVGQTVMQVFGVVELQDAIQAAHGAQAVEIEFELHLHDDAPRTFVAHVSPIGVREGVVAVLHEVSAARRADQVRRDFVANASHELRTPLTAIRGFAETLQNGAMNDPQAASSFIKIILKHARRLEALVDDIGQLSRAESDEEPLRLHEVEVRALVDEVVSGLAGKASARGITIEVLGLEQDVWVRANARALDQVLINLVENAIKYAFENTPVMVEAVQQEGLVRLLVKNQGAGIAKDHLDRVFERFYRVDEGRARDVGGTGLGLAICKHLVAAMQGEISVQSEINQETVFTVQLMATD